VLGLTSVLGIVVGNVIGSGIFIVPAIIASQTRSPVLMLSVWVTGGVLSFFGALAFAELGAAYPQAGGMYVFLREGYGRLIAFLFGWTLFLVIDAGAIATLAMAFSSKYLPFFLPLGPAAVKGIALLFVAVLVGVNCVGTRWGAGVQNTLTVIKFGAIAGVSLVVFLFARGNPANFVEPPPAPFSLDLVGAFGVALVATLWAYKGWEAPTFSAGEIRNPERNLPLGLLAGSAVVMVLYAVINLAYLYAIPVGGIATSDRIAADAMNAAVGPVGAAIISVIILFSITGAANGVILTAPRVFYAMARDGLFFRRFADVHPRWLTPHVAILATGA
jgi:APA family basic amino acid/polyamine antiporter